MLKFENDNQTVTLETLGDRFVVIEHVDGECILAYRYDTIGEARDFFFKHIQESS